MPTRVGLREIILVATLGALAPFAPARGQVQDQVRAIEVGTYACVTSHMAGIQHQQNGDIPTAGAATPRPEQAKFSVAIRRFAELPPDDLSRDTMWRLSIERINVGANTFAAKFSAGFVFPADRYGSIMLGHLYVAGNAKRAPNQYYGPLADVFSISYDHSFTAYSQGTYAVGRGGVFVLYGKCVETQ